MSKLARLPESLSFLSWLEQDREELYRSAWWLKSPFESNTWICDFGKKNGFNISFELEIKPGEQLSDPVHKDLLEVFKCWMCVQTHPDLTNGKTLGAETAFHAVSQVLRLIDYFLLNFQRYELQGHGLANLTAGDMRAIISDLASSGSTASSIYEWPIRLQEYLRAESSAITKEKIKDVLEVKPALGIIESTAGDRYLNLDDDELVRARVFLWLAGLYDNATKASADFRHRPSIPGLALLVYPNALWAKKTTFDCPEELCFDPFERYYREFESVPVRTSITDLMSEQRLTTWRATLGSLELLSTIKLKVPSVSVTSIQVNGWLAELSLKRAGRFQSLPQELVFTLLRSSIEYALRFGDDLVDSYVRLAKSAKQAGLSVARYSALYGLMDCLTPQLIACGVKTWHLGQSMSLSEANPARRGEDRAPASDYFRRVRANEGMFEMFCVLVGCVQICVGTLSARRQAELIALQAGACLDQDGLYLIFENRKTGVAGLRSREARPIPPIASRLIKMLTRWQVELVSAGCIPRVGSLFATPHRSSLSTIVSASSYNRCLDRVADYFSVMTDKNGRRYYLRQHQLRRFFATLFFWGRSFGGMDTLRWFMGHTDVRHLYHYVTEATPGAVLRSVKARYTAEELTHNREEHQDLATVIEKYFGTRQFSVLDSDELEDYISELIFRGTVTVEPQFLEVPNGTSYKIVIGVTGK